MFARISEDHVALSTEALVQLAISLHGEMRDRVSLRLYLGCRPQDNYEMTCGQKRGLVDRWNGSSVCCQSYQPVMSTCGQMCRLVDRWNGRFCLWTEFSTC